jgi:outer membrane protein insertion porin family
VLRFGANAEYLMINVGPGHRREWTSTEQLYSPADAPGIDRQTNYRRGGVFAEIDYRDNPGGPRSGGLYAARFTYNQDVHFRQYTFRRLDLEAQQYLPLFNQRRVIALRGKSVLSYSNPGQVVPFYMQPTLGGSEDLRGFRPYRFYDDNLIAFTAEYRYEIFSGLDMAIFGDAGKVFHRDWNVRQLEGDLGFGLRFNARNNVFLRIDTGFSREGWQIWFKFNNVF